MAVVIFFMGGTTKSREQESREQKSRRAESRRAESREQRLAQLNIRVNSVDYQYSHEY
jgi:hypothetical protein